MVGGQGSAGNDRGLRWGLCVELVVGVVVVVVGGGGLRGVGFGSGGGIYLSPGEDEVVEKNGDDLRMRVRVCVCVRACPRTIGRVSCVRTGEGRG